VLEGHQQNVNGVAFAPDGRTVITAGYDLTLRFWPIAGGSPSVVALPTPLNAVAVARSGSVVAAGATGKVYFLSAGGDLKGEAEAAATPIIALAISGDGKLVAASTARGAVAIIDLGTLLTGGSDRLIRRWNALTGEHVGDVTMSGPADPLAAYEGDRGAEVFRACVACHTLKADDAPGYDYSPALKKLDIVWTPETMSKLFEIGPAAYTPGTKMPEQRVGPEDRAALVKFLERATRP
jgi:cytochrome c